MRTLFSCILGFLASGISAAQDCGSVLESVREAHSGAYAYEATVTVSNGISEYDKVTTYDVASNGKETCFIYEKGAVVHLVEGDTLYKIHRNSKRIIIERVPDGSSMSPMENFDDARAEGCSSSDSLISLQLAADGQAQEMRMTRLIIASKDFSVRQFELVGQSNTEGDFQVKAEFKKLNLSKAGQGLFKSPVAIAAKNITPINEYKDYEVFNVLF